MTEKDDKTERIVCPSCNAKGSRGEITTYRNAAPESNPSSRDRICRCEICKFAGEKKLFTNPYTLNHYGPDGLIVVNEVYFIKDEK